jgi:hypothetical protein
LDEIFTFDVLVHAPTTRRLHTITPMTSSTHCAALLPTLSLIL